MSPDTNLFNQQSLDGVLSGTSKSLTDSKLFANSASFIRVDEIKDLINAPGALKNLSSVADVLAIIGSIQSNGKSLSANPDFVISDVKVNTAIAAALKFIPEERRSGVLGEINLISSSDGDSTNQIGPGEITDIAAILLKELAPYLPSKLSRIINGILSIIPFLKGFFPSKK